MFFLKKFNFTDMARTFNLMSLREKLIYLFNKTFFSVVDFAGVPLEAFGILGIITALENYNTKLFFQSVILIIIKNVTWWIAAPTSTFFAECAGNRAIKEIKTNLFSHIALLPMVTLDKEPKGSLLTIFSNNVNGVKRLYERDLYSVFHSILYGLTGVIVMLIIDYKFASIVLLFGMLSIFISYKANQITEKISDKLQEKISDSNIGFYEMIKSLETIRILNLQSIFIDKVTANLTNESELKINRIKINELAKAAHTAIDLMLYICILSIGAIFVNKNLATWGIVISILTLKEVTNSLFIESSEIILKMQADLANARRIFSFLDMKEEENTKFSIMQENNEDVYMRLKNVSFSYDGINQIINNLDLYIEKKGLILIFGESGSGKSTLIKLILGLYRPNKGEIEINNEFWKEASEGKFISYLPQEPILFEGSFFENITVFSSDYSLEQVEIAAKQAGIHDFIVQSKNKYDTPILEDGKNLSGGQKQRVALARALLVNPKILVLDEATSSVDKSTEQFIISIIKKISTTRAVIFISHNPEFNSISDKTININKILKGQ